MHARRLPGEDLADRTEDHDMADKTDDMLLTRREWMQASTMLGAAMVVPGCASAEHAGPHGHHGGGGAHHGFVNADEWAKRFDDPSRDAWQRPEEVLRALELAPTMIVADVGAGTGYFAVRLARAVPAGEVIAIDVEPDMVRYLNERARREQLPHLRTILADQTRSGLAADSVDRILVVHVWHHLADRVAYARGLAAALRPGGRICVVDFSRTGSRGPPMSMRLSAEAIVADLAAAGLAATLSPVALPDQYLVEGRRES